MNLPALLGIVICSLKAVVLVAKILTVTVAVVLVLCLLPGCATNGTPMRPSSSPDTPPSKSWLLKGTAENGMPVSCSFVEFDERGDFLNFPQHTDCQAQIREIAGKGPILLVIYCHGWKNNSQSGDVVSFNAFLAKLANTDEVRVARLHVHGVYLGWRGNTVPPFVDKGSANEAYSLTKATYHGKIVDGEYQRGAYWTGFLPENLNYWNRKGAAESRVSGLPMARAIFTYANAAKGYGQAPANRVCVIGHSFGALMLEKSLGQAMVGALVMEWWRESGEGKSVRGLPFDFVLFLNSAAPAIYAKEMRDFLEAHRRALGIAHDPIQDVPVIVSLTSTADWATGKIHPIANGLAPLDPSLQRKYTSAIVDDHPGDTKFPTHPEVRQSEFYMHTPGHEPYLINHWIVKQPSVPISFNPTPDAVFSDNLQTRPDPAARDLFFTSAANGNPAVAWELTTKSPDAPVLLGGMPPAMPNSDYWIVSCDKELIPGHNDVWTKTAMEVYAGLFRAVESRRSSAPGHLVPPAPHAEKN